MVLNVFLYANLLGEKANPFLRKVSFISFPKQRVEWFTMSSFRGSITRNSKCSNLEDPEEIVPLVINVKIRQQNDSTSHL